VKRIKKTKKIDDWSEVIETSCLRFCRPRFRRPGSFHGGCFIAGALFVLFVVLCFGRSPLSAQTKARTGKETISVSATQTYVRRKPSGNGPRAGVVKRGAGFAVKRRVRGPGCGGDWIELLVGGYLCSTETESTSLEPGGPKYPVIKKGKILPFSYMMIGRDGGTEYFDMSDAQADLPLTFLSPGFGRTYRSVVREYGLSFYETTRGTLVPTEDAFRVSGSKFRGVMLRGGSDAGRRSGRDDVAGGRRAGRRSGRGDSGDRGRSLPLVFTYRRRTPVYSSPGRRVKKRIKRFLVFRVVRAVQDRRRIFYYKIEPNGFVRARDVRLAAWVAPPYEVNDGEKWVDLDISQQTLVAYEGSRPVYATLMSSGRGNRTPTGVFRVWAKLAATDMSNDPEAERPYSMWNVPWTLYYKAGYAIHGTYWHSGFGTKRSHGCINLSPRDAKWVFDWSSPTLYPGWWARLPARSEESLIIRIRESTLAARIKSISPGSSSKATKCLTPPFSVSLPK